MNVKGVTSSARGVWWIQKGGNIGFQSLTKSPRVPGSFLVGETETDFTVGRLKEIRGSYLGDSLYALLANGSLVVHGGLTDVVPQGQNNDWVVIGLVKGDKLHDHINGVLVETSNGDLLEKECKHYHYFILFFLKLKSRFLKYFCFQIESRLVRRFST